MPELIDWRAHMSDQGKGRGALPANNVTGIAWHHTAVFYPAPNLTPAMERAHIAMIDIFHVRQGYVLFGYHGIAFASGRAYLTGDLNGVRSHVAGGPNYRLIGFCVAGDYSHSSPPDEALRALALLRRRAHQTRIHAWQEKGHIDWALPEHPTSCPGAQRAAWIPRIATIATEEKTMTQLIVIGRKGNGGIFTRDGQHLSLDRWEAQKQIAHLAGHPPPRVIELERDDPFFTNGPIYFPRGIIE